MKLIELLVKEQIEPNLKGENKFQIIEELIDRLNSNQQVKNRDQALEDVLAREGYLSTGLENGLAIPHAKTDGVDKLVISFGIKRDGVDFESLDGKPASLIFLVLSPRDTSGPHIQALATISRNLKDKTIREMILKKNTADEILEYLNQLNS
jgi:fructose-specific phosphotransferase system IIA component